MDIKSRNNQNDLGAWGTIRVKYIVGVIVGTKTRRMATSMGTCFSVSGLTSTVDFAPGLGVRYSMPGRQIA